VEANYRQALALCEQGEQGEAGQGGEPTAQVFSAQLGLWAFYQLRAQYNVSLPLGERLLGMAERSHKPDQLAEGHRVQGSTTFRLGQISVARDHMEQVLAVQPADQSSFDFLLGYGRDPTVHAMATLGWILWYQGLPDRARARSLEALALARQRPDAFNLALCLVFAAEVHLCRREVQKVGEFAEAAIAISGEQGFPIYLAWGTVLQGWAVAERGDHQAGIAQMRQGLDAYAATGASLARPSLLGLLADAHGMAGEYRAGLALLDEAMPLAEHTGERLDASTLLRLKGELLLAGSDHGPLAREEAEACFRKAVAIAHEQGARSLELRAALSLARLWQQEDKPDAARQVLAGVYGAFREGFETPDLQQAKALLDEVG